MAAIVFPTSSCPGAKPQEGAGRIVNGYAVKNPQGSRAPFRWPRSAGLREILSITGHSHCRGFILVGSTLLVVLNERVYAVTQSGSTFLANNLGALAGTQRVTIAKNNAGTPNIAAVTSTGTFNLFTASAPTSFADGDWPSVNSITAANGYMVGATGAGVLWATDLNAVTVASNSNESTQMPLSRVVFFRDELFAMGPEGIKVYGESGDEDDPFPFRYKKIKIPRGLAGTHAVAGFEEGWANELIWAAVDNNVYRLSGYSAEPIANEAVSRAIATCVDKTLLEASVYVEGLYSFWELTSPGEWTWVYNLTTGEWNEGQSYLRDDKRARCSVFAFDRWIRGDDTTGKLSSVDPTYYREYGEPLIWQLESGDNAAFPARLAIPRADFDFTAAVGHAAGEDPIEIDPKVMISWSLDGGYTWGNELTCPLGKQGESGRLVTINRIGLTKGKGVRFRLSVSDPVHSGFQGGQLPAIARAA